MPPQLIHTPHLVPRNCFLSAERAGKHDAADYVTVYSSEGHKTMMQIIKCRSTLKNTSALYCIDKVTQPFILTKARHLTYSLVIWYYENALGNNKWLVLLF